MYFLLKKNGTFQQSLCELSEGRSFHGSKKKPNSSKVQGTARQVVYRQCSWDDKPKLDHHPPGRQVDGTIAGWKSHLFRTGNTSTHSWWMFRNAIAMSELLENTWKLWNGKNPWWFTWKSQCKQIHVLK